VFGTDYGRALLVKLAFFGLVLLAGFYNWRVTRPRLAAGSDDGRRLRVSAGLELGFAALVLLATAVLTGLARP
jgi:putative copper export protein